VGLIPSWAAIKLPRSTQPSIPPSGVGKSSTGLVGWGYGGRVHQWCADLEIPSPQNSASASIGSADGPRPQVKLSNGSADRPRPQITTNELK